MGYSHYWRKEPQIDAAIMGAIVSDFNRVVLPLHDNGIPLAGPMGDGVPKITAELIAFNGLSNCGHPQNAEITIPWPTQDGGGLDKSHNAEAGHWFAGVQIEARCCNGSCDYETFGFTRETPDREQWDDSDGRVFDCCKTAFRPYDIAVTACLLIAKHRLGNTIKVSTDGTDANWFDAKMLCQMVLGYGLEYEVQAGVLLPVEGEDPYIPPTKAPEAKPAQPTRSYSVNETSKIIKKTLRAAFPDTKFSVRLDKYSGGCSIDASWMDGPTDKQVKSILDRFDGKGFDGMTDCSYYCGERMYKGERVDFHSGYVRGGRSHSAELLRAVAARVAKECGVPAPEVNESGYLMSDHDTRVPFQWHPHWHENKPLTMCDILAGAPILAHDSHEGEYLNRLIDRIAAWVSLKPVALPVELPEYIDVHAEGQHGARGV